MQLYHQIIHYNLGRTYYKMSISEKIKAINKKIEQNKAQYNLDRRTAKISALSSGNVSKYEFLTGKYVLPEKDIVEKSAMMKRFEYLSLGKELKVQIDIIKKQYQKLDDSYELHKITKKEKPEFGKYNRSNLIYDSKDRFYQYYNNKLFNSNSSFKSRHPFLLLFYNDLNKFDNLNPQKESAKERKVSVYNNASEI